MTSFDDVWNMTRDAAEKVGKKTGDLVELARLRLNLSDVERDISRQFEKLGRLVYDARRTEEDFAAAADACSVKLDALFARAGELRDRICALRNARRCTHCNTFNSEDSRYCKRCGKGLG